MKIVLYTEPHVADPCHLVLFSVDGVGLSGTKFIHVIMRYLEWLIKRYIKKFNPLVLKQMKVFTKERGTN